MIFYMFEICEGIHVIPASIIYDSGLWPFFILACVLLIGNGVLGIVSGPNASCVYDKDPVRAERNMLIQYAPFAAVTSSPHHLRILLQK
jgi:hypothetical protein